MDHHEKVAEFQRKFGQLVGDKPQHITLRKLRERVRHLREELDELVDAAMRDDLPDMADALIDITYLTLGTANSMGLGKAWNALFDDVHRANMAKERGEKVRQGVLAKTDAIKPPGWVGPQTLDILTTHGYGANDINRTYHDDEAEGGPTEFNHG